jgi:hypothetical protein
MCLWGFLLAAVGSGHVVEPLEEAIDDGGRRDINGLAIAEQIVYETMVVHG